jgi:glycosyltransferase involved in cell wall biosynthesis
MQFGRAERAVPELSAGRYQFELRTGLFPRKMTEAPRISVILLAHDRKKYVLGGVASALNQTLPRDRFEILVYKNFVDPEIDSYLEAHGVRNLTSPPESRPRTLRTVLRDARGEVLSFLDDDDRYAPEKLAFVDRVFTEDPSLGYFHHDFFVMDEDERLLERSPFPQLAKRVYLPAADVRHRSLPPNALKLGFNSSSVSVRRNWLTPFLPSFEYPEAELSDAMLLDCALASGCALLADPTKLTYYRYHDSWSNILHYSEKSLGPIVDFDTTAIGVLNLVYGFAAGTTLAPLFDEGLAYLQFHRSLFVDRVGWKPRPRDFFRLLRSGVHERNFAPFYLIPLHVVSRISRPTAQRAYFRLAELYRGYAYRGPSGS